MAVSMWKVLSMGAYSINRQAKLLADKIGAKYEGIYPSKIEPDDKYILVGSPLARFSMLINILKDKIKILYMTSEGRITDKTVSEFIKKYHPLTIAVSNTAKTYLEKSNIHVDEIFYHMIEPMPEITVSEKTIPFLYISGYMLRKYPRNLDPLFEKLSHMIVLATTRNNVYLNKYKFLAVFSSDYDMNNSWAPRLTDELKYKLYASAKFYLNLSVNEGFGLTPLEACYYGAIPIVPDIPVFHETLGDNAIYVPVSPITFEEFFPPMFIEHHQYDPNVFYEKAIESYLFYDEYKPLSKKCMNHAREWNEKNNYEKFKKYLI